MPTQGSNNNGNVAGYYYGDSVNPGLTHTAGYGYDHVNRLANAGATGSVAYGQSFTFDAYGNLNCAPSGPGCVGFTYNAANNRIAGYTYDAAGNVTNDGTNTYYWDAESHLIKVTNGGGTAISTNTYNALGQRVRDVTPTSITDEAYGADGELLWRYTGNPSDPNQRAFVPFEGGILAEYYSGGTIFDHPDQLGSGATASDYTGNNFQERLYKPFGEFWTGANLANLGMHQTFAKLPDYDPETDQYNTENRHYSPSGRWMSPDPGGVKMVHLDDPQTWNMYAYVRNNPTTLTDPTGLADPPPPGVPNCAQGNGQSCNGPAGGNSSPNGGGTTNSAQDPSAWSLSWQINASANFLFGELKGVADTTVAPLVNAVEHPVDTVEGVANAVAHPVETAENVAKAAVDTAKGVASGDPRAIGQVAGLVISTYVAARGAQGAEIKVSDDLRIAPTGNRTGPTGPIEGKVPHYHRRVVGPNGETVPGQGIGRHRPWETKSVDKSFRDRF